MQRPGHRPEGVDMLSRWWAPEMGGGAENRGPSGGSGLITTTLIMAVHTWGLRAPGALGAGRAALCREGHGMGQG